MESEILKQLEEHFASMTEEEKEKEFMEIDMRCNYGLDINVPEDRKKYKKYEIKRRFSNFFSVLAGVIALIIPILFVGAIILCESMPGRTLIGAMLLLIIYAIVLFRDSIFPENLINRR